MLLSLLGGYLELLFFPFREKKSCYFSYS